MNKSKYIGVAMLATVGSLLLAVALSPKNITCAGTPDNPQVYDLGGQVSPNGIKNLTFTGIFWNSPNKHWIANGTRNSNIVISAEYKPGIVITTPTPTATVQPSPTKTSTPVPPTKTVTPTAVKTVTPTKTSTPSPTPACVVYKIYVYLDGQYKYIGEFCK